MLSLIVAMVLLIVLSAVFSASEAALFSISKNKAEELRAEGRCSELFLKIVRNKDDYISTIVCLNNLANIMGSIYVGALAVKVFGELWLGLFTFVLTVAIIMFSEIIPKAVAIRKAQTIIKIMSGPLETFRYLLFPVVWTVNEFSGFLIRKMFGETKVSITSESEIRYLASAGAKCSKSGIGEKEAELIHKVFDLQATPVQAIMTPRIVMTTLSDKDILIEKKDFIQQSQHSRIILLGEDVDDVVGVVLKTDLMSEVIEGRGDFQIRNLECVRTPFFVGDDMTAACLIKIFQKNGEHIAIVKDAYDGVCGVVTLEDAIEQLIGEIVDETDVATDMQMMAKAKGKLRKNKLKNAGSEREFKKGTTGVV